VRTLEDLLEAAGFTLEITTRLGDGVDRTLIRAALERSPEERIRAAATAARNLRTFLDATSGQQPQP
jgi:hypothetical protein